MYTEESQTALRERWATALESGEYQQTQGNLHNKEGYCCLGVLCDLVKDEIGGMWIRDFDTYSFSLPTNPEHEPRTYASTLPSVVQDMLGVRDSMVRVETSNQTYTTLAHINDNGASFETIAQVIRNNYKF